MPDKQLNPSDHQFQQHNIMVSHNPPIQQNTSLLFKIKKIPNQITNSNYFNSHIINPL